MDPGYSRGGDRGLRAPVRGGPALPRQPPHQLVHLLSDGAVRPRGRVRRGAPRGSCTSSPTRFADGSGELVVATTRPETMLGDTAIAVHSRRSAPPGQDRQEGPPPLRRPARSRVIADAMLVDPKFGTGAVKVTPAHDPNDFECGQRHGLPSISILDERGNVTAEGGPFAGHGPLRRPQGGQGAAEGAGPRSGAAKPHVHSVGHCQRCNTVVEPLHLDPVVRQDGAAGRASHRGGRAGQDPLRPRELDEDLLSLDAEHPRLVHLAPALVGPPHPGLVLRRLQRGARGAPGPCGLRAVWRERPEPGRRRARHLVLVLAVALRHPGLAGRDARAEDLLSHQRCWSPATTSCSSGWPA